VIGTHFFNPVHLMRLLEVVVGRATAPATVAAIQAFGRAYYELRSTTDVYQRA
jgi:3-hydroxyacyl-CoA dehydrogenase